MVQGVSEHFQKSTSRQVRPSAIQCEPYNAWQVGGFNFYHGRSATGSSSAWLTIPPRNDGGKDRHSLHPPAHLHLQIFPLIEFFTLTLPPKNTNFFYKQRP